jgi:hypothetical protein
MRAAGQRATATRYVALLSRNRPGQRRARPCCRLLCPRYRRGRRNRSWSSWTSPTRLVLARYFVASRSPTFVNPASPALPPMAMLTLVGFWASYLLLRRCKFLLLRQCKFRQQVLAGHRPQSTEAERLRDQDRDFRKFQGNTRAVLQLLASISRHRLCSRWGPFFRCCKRRLKRLLRRCRARRLPSKTPARLADKCNREQASRLQNSLTEDACEDNTVGGEPSATRKAQSN